MHLIISTINNYNSYSWEYKHYNFRDFRLQLSFHWNPSGFLYYVRIPVRKGVPIWEKYFDQSLPLFPWLMLLHYKETLSKNLAKQGFIGSPLNCRKCQIYKLSKPTFITCRKQLSSKTLKSRNKWVLNGKKNLKTRPV